ncbi:MAG TPA: DUF4214 domain-containing protein [Gemmataceae bacterium]|nr:DUF4214 domain-containing protein [Gemmataceae bacterium]
MFHALRTGNVRPELTPDIRISRIRQRRSSTRVRPRLQIETLEDRFLPSTFVVTDSLDAAPLNPGTDNPMDVNNQISLRSAIAAANVDAILGTSDTINFAGSLAGTTLTLSQGQLDLSGVPATGSASITVDASALAGGITISNNGDAVFQVDSGVTAVFNGLTIPNAGEDGIENLGILTLNGCTIGGSTFVNDGIVQGGTLNFVDGSILLGDGTLTSVTVPAGSDVHYRSNSDFGDTITMTGSITNDGTIELSPTNDGEDANLIFSGDVILAGTGQLLLDPQVGSFDAYAYPSAGSTVTIAAGQTVSSVGVGNYFGINDAGTVIDQGVVEATGAGNALNMEPSLITNTGTLEATGGAELIVAPDTSLDNQGTVVVESDSAVSAIGPYTQTAGTTDLEGGALTVNTLGLQGGTLAGTGTVTGNVTNSGGAVEPGGAGAAGVLAVNGAYTQDSGGTLDLDIGGASSSQFDQLNISGSANLAGALNVNLLSGFTPAAGQDFAVLTAGSLSGTFASLSLPSPLMAAYSTTAVTLEAGTTGLVVTNTNATGPGSLAQAVADANASATGGTITFATAAEGGVFNTLQSIALTGTLELNNPNTGAAIVIDGPAAGVTIGGGGPGSDFSVFTVAANTTATLEGLAVTDGYATAGGGIGNEAGATLTLSNDDIFGNSAAYGAGVDNHGTLRLNSDTLVGNSASSDGGGIDNEFAATLTVNNGSISGNAAGEDGGAIENRGTLAVTGAVLSQNNAQRDGGALNNLGTLTVNGSTLSDNAALNGGGIDNYDTLTVSTSTLAGNSATSGGGIANFAAVTVSASTLVNNSSQKDGGGIFNNGELTVINSTLTGNSAVANGGAVANELAASATLSNATVSGNSAANGGGIANISGTLVLNNTIVAGDNATTAPDLAGAYGGNANNVVGGTSYLTALMDFGGPTETMAPEVGGPAIGKAGAVTTLAAAVNKGATTISVADAAAIASTSGNYLIQVDAEQMLVTAVNPTSNTLTVVRGYNGTTPAGHAVQAGIYFPTDQRGVSRPAPSGSPGPDIGAFQSGGTFNLVVTTAAGSAVDSAGLLSLPAAVNLADELSGNITITFADAPGQVFATPQTINLTAGLNLTNSTTGTSISIDGPPAGVTIAGGGKGSNFSVFTVAANTTATLQGLTITDGYTNGNGGGILNNGTLTVTDAFLSSNSAEDFGGGIANYGTLTLTTVDLSKNYAGYSAGGFYNSSYYGGIGQVTATNLTLSANNAASYGGGFSTDGGTVTVTNGTISGNSSGSGGGINASGTETLIGVTISDNNATYYGGGIVNYFYGITLTNCTISGNNAAFGGGIDSPYSAPLTVTNGTISDNSAITVYGFGGVGGGIFSSAPLTLSGVTISGNTAVAVNGVGGLGGGMYFAPGGTLTVSTGTFSIAGNTASQDGAGVYVASGETLTLSNVTISGNVPVAGTTIDGGGIYNVGALTVNNATISNNSANSGGGIFNFAGMDSLALSNATISDNSAESNGGGIDNANGAGPGEVIYYYGPVLTLSDVTISSNSAAEGGGISSQAPLTVSNVTISGNSASDNGGGIYFAPGGTLTVSSGTFSISGNTASDAGAGVYVANGETLTLSNVTISGNVSAPHSQVSGAGIYNEGMLTVSNATISDNFGAIGGIENEGTLMTVSNSTISGNSSFGGGVIVNYYTLTVSNSTISGNSTSSGYSVILNDYTLTVSNTTISGNSGSYAGTILNFGTLTVSNATISGNSASAAGGGIYNSAGYGTLTLQNSIVAGNTAPNEPDIYGGITTDNGHNLLGTALRPTNPVLRFFTTDVFSDQPLLSPLGNYGGPTPTMAPLPGSPAVGNSGPLTTVATQVTISTSRFFFEFHPRATITVSSATDILEGDTIQIDVVQMEVEAVNGNSLTVSAGFNATFHVGDGVYLIGQTDQRGFSRPTTSADIGAFQTQSSLVVNTTADPAANTPTGSFTGGTLGQLSLREAVNLANVLGGNNTVTFASGSGQPFNTPQTITLAAGIDLANPGASITVEGPPAGVTISGGGAGSNFSVFTVAANTTATLEGLTITDGNTNNDGGGIDNNGVLTVKNATLSANSAGNDGGGIDNAHALTVSDITLTGNEAPHGSGIDNEPGAELTVNNASVSGTPSGPNVIVNAGTVTVPKGDTFSAASANYTQTAGTTTVNGKLAAVDIFLDGGLLNGTGTIQGKLVNNGGTVAPGDDPGTLTVLGDYTQAAAGTLQIEIGGPTDYSQLAISGSATLGGTFDSSFINGFTPGADDSFQTLMAGQISGDFATMTGLNGDQVTPVNNAGGPSLDVNDGQTSTSTVALQTTAPSGSVYGQTVTFTATVSAGSSSSIAPTGTVQFRIDGSNFGPPVTLIDGSAGISTAGLSAGTHAVTAIYSGDSTFLGNSIALSSGQAVAPAPLTITANNQTMVFGGALPTLTAGYSGLVNGDTPATFSISPSVAPTLGTVPATSQPGSYAITVSGAVDPNYTITFVSGTLTISPAPTLDQLFVEHLYQDLLQRPVDPSGLAYWSTALDDGSMTRQQVAAAIVASTEYKTDEIGNAYQTILGRPADAAGLTHWLGFLSSGGTIVQLEAQFYGSAEFFQDSGGTNNGFLAALYKDALGRPIDPTGLQQWGQELAGGTSTATVAASILGSAEAETDQVQNIYQQFLHRAADSSGVASFVGALQIGTPIETIIAAVAGSAEYAQDAGGDANQAYVQQIYLDLLGRPADAGALAAFSAGLDDGQLTRGQFVQDILDSAEYRSDVVGGLYQLYLGRNADPAGLSAFTADLAKGSTDEQSAALIAGSAEFFTDNGGTNAGFLNAIYEDALGRPIDPTGLTAWEQALALGATRGQVAAAIFGSSEYQQYLVQTLYQRFLQRPADAGGLATFANLLASGARDEVVIAQLLESSEYYNANLGSRA